MSDVPSTSPGFPLTEPRPLTDAEKADANTLFETLIEEAEVAAFTYVSSRVPNDLRAYFTEVHGEGPTLHSSEEPTPEPPPA